MIDQDASIQIVESITGSISIISCIFMSFKMYRNRNTNIANKMLTFLFFLDFILAITYTIGRSVIDNHGFCQFQVKYHIDISTFRFIFFINYIAVLLFLLGIYNTMVFFSSNIMGSLNVIFNESMDCSKET